MFDSTTRSVPARSWGWMLAATSWVVASIAVAASGALARIPILAAVWVGGSIAAWVAMYRSRAGLRDALERIDLRIVIALHVIRAPIGALFLVEHARGRLDETFAYRAGIGDIAIGVLAIAAMALYRRRAFVRAWSFAGIADLALAVSTAQFLVLVRHDPLLIAAFGGLPYPLLPALIVPTMILAHLLVLARTRR